MNIFEVSDGKKIEKKADSSFLDGEKEGWEVRDPQWQSEDVDPVVPETITTICGTKSDMSLHASFIFIFSLKLLSAEILLLISEIILTNNHPELTTFPFM